MLASRSRWRHHLVVLLLYAVFSLALTYPLVRLFCTHVPGDGIDDPALAWNLWWVKFSLVNHQANPFPSGWMFYPLGINLAFYTLTILNGLLSVPLQTALGLVPAVNLVLLSSFVLSGYGAYLLAMDVLGSAKWQVPSGRCQASGFSVQRSAFILPSAFIAGLLYAFSSTKLFYAALGQFNIASSQWIPFAVLYIIRSGRPGARLREPTLAALFIVLQAYAELTYASFLAIFAGLYAAFRLVQIITHQPHTDRSPAANLLRNLIVLSLVVAIGLLPILVNMLPDMQAEGDFLLEGSGFADLFSADLAGFAFPTQLHPFLGDLVREASADSQLLPDGSLWQVNKGQHLTLGYIGLALTIMGLAWGLRHRWTESLFWALAALAFFLLALGPTVRFAGHDTGVPGPFQLLQALPFFKANRYPSRYSVMLLVSIVPLLAAGTLWILKAVDGSLGRKQRSARRRRWMLGATTGLLATGLLLENLSLPLPVSDMRVPTIYQEVVADLSDTTVLDLPMGWRNGFNVFGKEDPIIMSEQWWQTEHAQPILGGNTSRNPEHKFRYFLEAPLIGPLTVLANADEDHPHIRNLLLEPLAALRSGNASLGDDDMLRQAAADGPAVLATLNAGYVAMHRDHLPEEFVAFAETYLPLELIAEEGQHALYAVDLPPAPAVLVVSPALDPLSRGEGWSGMPQVIAGEGGDADTLWAHRRQTRLLLPPLQPGPHRITLRARAPGPGQTVSMSVNGLETPAQPLPESWSELAFEVPDGVLGPRTNEIVLRFGQTFDVSEMQGGQETSILVESAGLEAGNYGHIWLNGIDIAPGGRGYNLALIDTPTGQPIAADTFDTHGDPDASDALIAFLDQMEEHDILAVAVKDTAGDQLSVEAAQRLAGLGLTDLRGLFRWSQAALVLPQGIAGSSQPAVVEQVDGLRGSSVGLGPGWREPEVAAAVEWLRVE